MSNLADPKIARDVDVTAKVLARFGTPVSPVLKAALQAYIEATRHPDSLVLVVVQRDLDTMLVLEYLQRMDTQAAIDWEKTSREVVNPERDFDRLLLLEFKNGSAIEVRGS